MHLKQNSRRIDGRAIDSAHLPTRAFTAGQGSQLVRGADCHMPGEK
jgi:hypothetical protein